MGQQPAASPETTENQETRPEPHRMSSRLEELAGEISAAHQAVRRPSRSPLLIDYLDDYEKIVKDAIRFFQRASDQESFLPYSAEWLLDNSHIVRQAIREVRQDFPAGYYHLLPKLVAGELEGLPRVYALARDLIVHEKANLEMDRVRRFVGAYQATTPLTMGELWAVPIMLRLGILQALVLALTHLTESSLESKSIGGQIPVINLGEDVSRDEIVSSCVVSLRTLAAENWKDFFESLSQVERILAQDPANLYTGMDFDTRDRYRKVIETLSIETAKSEQEVARTAVRLAQRTWDASPIPAGLNRLRGSIAAEQPAVPQAWDHFTTQRNEHVGYYLLDHGRMELEQALAYRPDGLKRIQRWIFEHPTPVYLGAIAFLSAVFISFLLAYLIANQATALQIVAAVFLALAPSMNVAVTLVNWLITNTVSPRVLPQMDFSKNIPEDCTTIVVIPALLAGQEDVKSLLQQLELHFLRNQDDQLLFALATDFADAPDQHVEGDDELVQAAGAGIDSLNRKYRRGENRPFYLFHRERRWNEREKTWMGWERKRGKLHELNKLILGKQDTTFVHISGDLSRLSSVRYVVTLDTDTALHRGSVWRLVATLAHPLNRAEFDSTGLVTAGYTILQPRTDISPTSINQSYFTRIFTGDTGLDLYTLAVSDVYQDFFGEGIYVGKGIYDVAAFERSLEGRVPENALLSHDLFEGIHGRAGLATHIVLIEDYPPNYLAHTNRLQRWIRGDWQLLPWLLPTVPAEDDEWIPNRLSIIDRWKIFDNLRRSLVPLLLLAFFAAGWAAWPGSALAWTLIGALALAGPVITGLLSALLELLRGITPWRALQPLGDQLLRWVLALVFLPYEAVMVLDAVLTTLARMTNRREKMLQWTTAAQSARRLGESLTPVNIWQKMIEGPLVAVLMALMLFVLRPGALWAAAPVLILWFLSPQIAYLISRPIRRVVDVLTAEQEQELRTLARQTWLFFEQFVGPEDRWLPPDHFQEYPRGVVAHRTSPTNIGLALLSDLGAFDIGYNGVLNLATRLQVTFETLEQLERSRGHFLNWYDTRTLAPLPPRYISTVDSGNLAACLIALGQGCQQVPAEPVLRWEMWSGFLDLLHLLENLLQNFQVPAVHPNVASISDQIDELVEQVTAVREDPRQWASLLESLVEGETLQLEQSLIQMAEENPETVGSENLRRLRIYSRNIRSHLLNAWREVEVLLPWLTTLNHFPLPVDSLGAGTRNQLETLAADLQMPASLRDIPAVSRAGEARLQEFRSAVEQMGLVPQDAQAFQEWAGRLQEQLASASYSAKALAIGFDELSRRAGEFVQEMDFSFLFNQQRRVFHIGYNLELDKLDNNFYDLLASEARIASLVAIAKRDVPQIHWLHLARPITQVDSTQVLLSWSATMFEYLMPVMLLRSYEGTLLNQTVRAAAAYQIEYGRNKRVPWGISESGYYRFDENLNYQYRAFGVPGLGYKRGLGDDLVITPYASLLALPLRPRQVLENIRDLQKIHMLGIYGLYEAVDFTTSRLSLGHEYEIVRSYMAHHQGMIFLSLVNYFKGDVMVHRFHSHPLIQSVELLLQEQIPQNAPVEEPLEEQEIHLPQAQPAVATHPWSVPVDTFQPRVHTLSNGRYNLLINNSGGGYSSWKEFELTRWRPDTTINRWGTWIYIQDRERGRLWSPTFQPLRQSVHDHAVQFSPHMAEFRHRTEDISSLMELVVAPDEDVEVRRLTLTNHSDAARRLNIVSYGEAVLAPGGDHRHPAYNKLFIESEWIEEINGLSLRRRPRKSTEEPVFLIHFLVAGPGVPLSGGHESDRARFLGRGRTVQNPQALEAGGELSRSTGATLDPVLSVGQEILLEPHDSTQLAFITLAAETRQQALELARRYSTWHVIERAFDRARSNAEVEFRRLNLSTPQLENIQKLLSVLVYPHPVLRAPEEVLAANRSGQPGLWAYGISGDYPVLLLRIGDVEQLALLQEALIAHSYWRSREIKIDLVILNEQGSNYGQELNNQIHHLLNRTESSSWLNRRGGIFLLLQDQLNEADNLLLQTSARAVLYGGRGALAAQLSPMDVLPTRLPPFEPPPLEAELVEPSPELTRPQDLLFDNGYGGFTPDQQEYLIHLEPGQWTPAPWVNVIANPEFGFLVSEASLNTTWALNSGENRISTWHNDPISDPPAEAIYLRDEENGEFWTPTPLPTGAPAAYQVRHGAGYTIFEHGSHGLKQTLRLFVPPDEPVKILQLRLENTWNRTRRLTVTYYADWVMGVSREQSQMFVTTQFHAGSQAILAQNFYNTEFSERVSFAAASKTLHGLTADRMEFLGRQGSLENPAALHRIGLSGVVGAGMDPCAALQLHVDLQPGEFEEVYFLLGQGENMQAAVDLVQKYQQVDQVAAAWEAGRAFWEQILGSVQVRTPDSALDLLLNRFLLYQALACRIWGRTALYQSSGAYGFRDQLQDVMSTIFAAPEVTREQILRAARHQFEAGDVLHWWHPPSGRGIRTRMSDDLLWLPFVTAFYVQSTGDVSILHEQVPFLQGPLLQPDEEERYGQYQSTDQSYTLYEHCRRAIEKGVTSGPHQLPLIGTGDWNDGMNRVGVEGRGESVWLGWFIYTTLMRFAEIADCLDERTQAGAYRDRAARLKKALNEHAWDGRWYLRAFYDDGAPLGSSKNRECQIDAIAQSWAVISGAGEPERTRQAMQAVAEKLVREEDGLLLLFTPPFDETPRDPGYIKGYLPGIRENGGQYTHAAIWSVWAFLEMGQAGYGYSLFRILNPILHADTQEKAALYKVEPYVIAADVYGEPPHVGRGGWTWYTGSSGWMYRLGLEAILGLSRDGEHLIIRPRIPSVWPGYEMTVRLDGSSYRIVVENPQGVSQGVREVYLDGQPLRDGKIPLQKENGEYQVRVVLGNDA